MTETVPSISRTSLLSRIWEFLRAIDEAAHTSEMDMILSRLNRLERAVIELRKLTWNTRDPAHVVLAYTSDSRWRNRAEFM
jgi:hypothetical protein